MDIQPIDFSGSIQNWSDSTADYVARIAIAPIETIQIYDGIHGTQFSQNFGINATAEQIAATRNPPLVAVVNASAPSATPTIPVTNPTAAALPLLVPDTVTANTAAEAVSINQAAQAATTGASNMTIQTVDFSGATTGWKDADAYWVSTQALAPITTIRTYDLKNQTTFAKVWGQDASDEQKAAATPSVSMASSSSGLLVVGLVLAVIFWPRK